MSETASSRLPDGSSLGPFLAYNAALGAASPLLLAWYAWRVLGSGKSREGWLERLGIPSESQRSVRPGHNVWLHAVSVGEVVAAAPVVRKYLNLEGSAPVEMSTITGTGREMAEKLLPEVPKMYLPVDLLPPVRSVMSRLRPLCLVLCEKEFWPNLLNEGTRVGACSILINGAVSERMAERSRRFGWIYRWALGNIARFLMQSEEDAERVVDLGACEERVSIAGNTKFDEADEPLTAEERTAIAAACGLAGADRPIFVAGSTNPGEDAVVLEAFRSAREAVPGLRLVIAPRQIERADDICAAASSAGFTSVKRSQVSGAHGADAVVLNTFGELAQVYALASAAFVGGTFIDKGGHNILQPLAQGVPVTFGPYDYKIRDIADQAVKAGVAFRAGTVRELGEQIGRLSGSGSPGDMRELALRFVRERRGASARCAAVIHEMADRTLRERAVGG